MGKKKRKRKQIRAAAPPATDSPGGWKLNNWVIVAGILFFICAGLLMTMVMSPGGRVPGLSSKQALLPAATNGNLENNVRLVSANFRCACGNCGELPLIDCTCDSPKGAKETKAFIRERLREGLTVDQVIPIVEQAYGHRI